MPIIVSSPRKRLRVFLENQLKLQEKSNSPEACLLRMAIEGLVALNYGESRPIYKPSAKKGSHGGSRPYTIRKLKMRALGFADLLKVNKYKPAIHTVATAYGETTDTFTGWTKDKRLGKTTDPLMMSFREEIATLVWNETEIFQMLKKAGQEYQLQKKLAYEHKK